MRRTVADRYATRGRRVGWDPGYPRVNQFRRRGPVRLCRVAAKPPVELHVISDSTGETAARLVLALEAQFPEQVFEEIRHPRVESVDDLALAVNRAKGRPAVVVYTLVKPELRDAMRQLCRRAKVHYCDLLGHPIDAVARVSGQAARMTPGARPAAQLAVLQAHGGDRVRGQVRRRRRPAACTRPTSCSSASRARRRRRSRCTSATSATRPRTCLSSRESSRRPSCSELEPTKIVGLTIDAERLAEIRTRARGDMGGGQAARTRSCCRSTRSWSSATTIHRRLGCPVIEMSEIVDRGDRHRVVRLVTERRAEAARKRAS